MKENIFCSCISTKSNQILYKGTAKFLLMILASLFLVYQSFAGTLITVSPSSSACIGTSITLGAGNPNDDVDWFFLNGSSALNNSNNYTFTFSGNISIVVRITQPNFTVLRDTAVITLNTGDNDNDGVPNCSDGCPGDPNKTAPGTCGCGASDADFDNDGLANCVDGCPTDPNKTSPGTCGCGRPDTNTDGDLLPDCFDQCPTDPNKLFPGACGCGEPDIDSDGDGTPNCIDGCPFNSGKTTPGVCGCNVADLDSDADGVLNCNDACPFDRNKLAPGSCGCGNPETDVDNDGTPNCVDGCPNDRNKTTPGICGCGNSDADNDLDGTPNCNDLCPNDINKITPGICGCGIADADDDGDGRANCDDGCPNDVNKTAPGICGCGVADTDIDNDGRADCNDGCPNDANKFSPGACGCGVADTDSDNDGTPNCNDLCPNDINKIGPGLCGCGTLDLDSDNDGTPNCNDLCPNNPNKVAPGQCGCALADTDADNDGIANCNDLCPNNPNKTSPGICGCSTLDTDTDNDGTPDCNDSCPLDVNKTLSGICGCGIADIDTDNDGTPDCIDVCPFGPINLDTSTTQSVCGPDGTATVNVISGGSGNYAYLWNDGTTTQTLTGLFPATYQVTVTDLNTGCADSIGAVVTPRPGSLFVVGFNSTNVTCQNGTNGSATALISGGIGPFSFLWSNAATSQTINTIAAGNYEVTVTDRTTGCTGFGTVIIQDGLPYNVSLGPDRIVCLNESITLSVSNAVSVNFYLLNGTLLQANLTSYTASYTSNRTIVIQAFNNANCIDFDTITISITSVDSDNDGTPDCADGCPNDPNKIATGTCGCGVRDIDSDNDGTPNCNDQCPNDPNKILIGFCGCGQAEGDTDNDGTPDCADNCPNDINKINAGICGCGISDIDADGDGTPNCNDQCPNDPDKVAFGICGCGQPDTDTDGDGSADCFDNCPFDPLKNNAGICGCGVVDIDTDNDNTFDCFDECPLDPNKIIEGLCGCGIADIDTDNDNTPDCFDECPFDPNKIFEGACGCGIADTDSDNDGTPNCFDECPQDPNKILLGACGCGIADTDTDNDGIADCNDDCPIGNLNITPSSINADCGADGNASVIATGSSGSYSYLWSNNTTNASINNVFAGTYNITVTDIMFNTCIATQSITVNTNPNSFAIDNVDTVHVDCFGANNGAITVSTINGFGNLFYTWNPNVSSSNTATNLSPGIYVVNVFDDNSGCEVQAIVNITEPNLFSIQLGNNRFSCSGTNETFSINNATVVNWRQANGALLLANNANYTFAFLNTTSIIAEAFNANGCIAFDTITIYRDSLDTDLDGTANCNDLCPLDANKIAPGVCGCGFLETDSDNDGTPDCNDLCPTDPNLTIPGLCGCNFPDTDTDADGTPDCNDFCVSDASKTVPGLCGCGITEVDTDNDGVVDCLDFCPNDSNKSVPGACGCNNADIDSDFDGVLDCIDACPNDVNKILPGICGCNNLDIDSDNDGALDCNDLCPLDANKVSPGTCGCGNVDNYFVNAGNDQFICKGTAAILEATQGNNYLWNNGETTASIAVFPIQDTTIYSVSISNGLCTAIDTVIIYLLPKPNISAGNDDTICTASIYTLKATGGILYLWSNGVTDSINTLIVNQDTTLEVTGFDANGCFNRDAVTIYTLALPSLTTSNDTTICSGNSLALFANGATSYLWSNADSTSLINVAPLINTIYQVTATGNNGCQAIESIVVTVNASPVIDAGPSYITCQGDIRTLTGISNENYLWSSNETTPNITVAPLATTTYYLSATNSLQCTAIDSATVFVNPLPIASAGNNIITCKNNEVSITATGGVLYSWNNGDTIATTTFVTLDSQLLTVIVTDTNGCSDIDSVNVFANQLPIVDAGNNQSICQGDTAIIAASGALTYIWSNGKTQATFIDVPQISTNYRVVGIDTNGCINSDSISIIVNQKPTASFTGETNICLGNNISLTASGGIIAIWNQTDTLQTFTANPTINTNYSLEVIDANGCSNTIDINVAVNDIFNAQILGLKPSYCSFQNAILLEAFPSGGVFSGTAVTNNIFNPNEATQGTYLITYVFSDSRGCISLDTANVIVETCAGINDENNIAGITVFPNPFTNSITIQLADVITDNMDASLYDLSGKLLFNETINCVSNCNSINLNLPKHLAKGNYVLAIKTNSFVKSFSIMKTE